jgi:hypothetical protein
MDHVIEADGWSAPNVRLSVTVPFGPGSVSVVVSDPSDTSTGRSALTSMLLNVTATVHVPAD